MLNQIDHVNIVVRDLPLMIAFYCDILGMKETLRVRIEGDWISIVVGLQGAVAECVYLQPDTGPRIELLKYLAPDGTKPEGLELSHTCGIRHIAFRVPDVDLAWRRLSQDGVPFISPPITVPLENVTQTTGRKRLCYFHDPEGNLLEICDYAVDK